ncbi:chaperonin GroEL (HSP60 family) [Halarchaeum solikamskense]|uniref:TCP-1/cpn60 chaperonin family protein n=1 Tax=Halarchaeum nitratireducens TaxID=489913 RepID=UPI001B3A9D55|nr:TCP-1/cpn60 chaperonin family protein [Halarchaeum solikamskense]MBP2252445.1 chaperonin GroEL (HSP60 family) [Halarchaeum solikamskense]
MSPPTEIAGRQSDVEDVRVDPPIFPHANVVAVRAIADVLDTTYGPASRDKLVINALESRQDPAPGQVAVDDYVTTSDGATILESLPLEHPVAPVVRRMVGPERPGDTDVEGEDVFDGVTTSVSLAAALLREAESLVDDGVHPIDLIRGYRRANDVATEALADLARPLDDFDDPDAAARSVARTAMTGNDVGGLAETWAKLACDAAGRVGYPTAKTLPVRTIRDGSLGDSRLVRGTVLDRSARVLDSMPDRVEDASVLVLGGHDRGGLRTPDLPDDYTASVDEETDVADLDAVFDAWRTDVWETIHGAGVDVVVAELGIDDGFLERLAEHDVVGIRAVNRLKLSHVARATGATVVKDLHDVSADDLGHAGVVAERRIERAESRARPRRMTVFEDCATPDSVCVLVQGVPADLGERAATSIRQAAAAVALARGERGSHPGVVPGGGAAEAHAAAAVRDAARADGSRAALATTAFADALEQLPFTLARNAGVDPVETVADLRAANRTDPWQGFVLPAAEIGDTAEAGVLDPVTRRTESYRTATAVSSLILRVDDAIDAEVDEDAPDPGDAIYDEAAEQHMDSLTDA